MISKENYEIWMIDYLDGNLSGENLTLFLQFLEEHPELKSELEDLNKTILRPDNSISFDKDDLLKTEADEIEIPFPDYIAIKEVEEGLNQEELLWKEMYINEDKNNHILFEDYKKTILRTIHSISYPTKNTLKRVKIVPYLTIKKLEQFGIAATIAIGISVGSWYVLKINKPQHQITAFKNKSVETKDTLNKQAYTKIAQIESSENNTQKTHDTEKQRPAVSHNKQIYTPSFTNEKSSFKRDTMQFIATSASIQKLRTEKVNAFEVGLNNMMPLLISNSLQNKKEQEMAMKTYISKESQRLERQARFISKGAKVLNFLSGNNTTIHRITNDEGELIAYQVESDNLSVRKKIKNVPVTN